MPFRLLGLPCASRPAVCDARAHFASLVSNPSLERHGLFINQFVATGVLEILWQLFRHGGLDYSELYFNLKTGRMMPKIIDCMPI